ncbi:MAG: two-component sensor histidine kinase [Curvibacter sp.]|nr:two-component sensor histidine kinase [Curvibacter sp.]
MPTALPPLKFRRWRRDLVWLLGAVALEWYASARGNWSEHYSRFAQRYEDWQLDEWPLTLLMLSLGLCWFAWRRMGELREALAEHMAAEQRISELLEQNQHLARQLIGVQEEERRAIARELHDEFGQGCTAIRIEARLLAQNGAPDAVRQGAQRIGHHAEHLYRLVRERLTRLRPHSLDSLGLEAALQELCEGWEDQTGIACRVQAELPAQALDDAVAVTLFRLVQEGLTNIARHARASEAQVSLQAGNWPQQPLSLRIEDNGCGLPGAAPPSGGFGLAGMRERVAALQGQWRLDRGTAGGVRIQVLLPAEARA